MNKHDWGAAAAAAWKAWQNDNLTSEESKHGYCDFVECGSAKCSRNAIMRRPRIGKSENERLERMGKARSSEIVNLSLFGSLNIQWQKECFSFHHLLLRFHLIESEWRWSGRRGWMICRVVIDSKRSKYCAGLISVRLTAWIVSTPSHAARQSDLEATFRPPATRSLLRRRNDNPYSPPVPSPPTLDKWSVKAIICSNINRTCFCPRNFSHFSRFHGHQRTLLTSILPPTQPPQSSDYKFPFFFLDRSEEHYRIPLINHIMEKYYCSTRDNFIVDANSATALFCIFGVTAFLRSKTRFAGATKNLRVTETYYPIDHKTNPAVVAAFIYKKVVPGSTHRWRTKTTILAVGMLMCLMAGHRSGREIGGGKWKWFNNCVDTTIIR